MACFHPLTAYRSLARGGKIVFSKPFPFAPEFKIPCGRCSGCRLEYSRQWAMRCWHEASLYEDNCFVTLTFDSDHYPRYGALEKDTLQRFLKRLRKRHGSGIRFFACGEYGDLRDRPHFHLCLFNFDFADKQLWTVRNGVRLFVSADLADLWPFGFSTVGQVTFESAAYVARYVMKKVSGSAADFIQPDGAPGPYVSLDDQTGELVSIPPEFVVMSRGGRGGLGGIGKGWIDQYMNDTYKDDFVVVRGRKMKPPRYYDLQLEKVSAHEHESVKLERRKVARQYEWNNTTERLKVREEVHLSRISQLKRSLDNED